MLASDANIDAFIEHWRATGGSELANTQSFINGLCAVIGVAAPDGSHADDARNDYVFERRVFQDNGDGTKSFGRVDAYKKGSFVHEAKQARRAVRPRRTPKTTCSARPRRPARSAAPPAAAPPAGRPRWCRPRAKPSAMPRR